MDDLGLIALILIVPPWYHLGRFFVERLMPDLSPDLRDGIAVALGFAILSYAIVILALFEGLNPVVMWLFTIVPFLVTLPFTIKRIRSLPNRWRTWSENFNLPADKALWLLIGLLFLFDLICCGNAAVGWDAAVYHYAAPNAFLRSGALIDVPENPFSYYPLLVEMLFTLGLGLNGEFLAGALTWIFLLPLTAGMLSIGRRLGSDRIGLWALVLFLGAPLTFELPFSGLVDLPFLVYCLLAIAVLLETGISIRQSVLIGLLVGCSAATKHLGLLFLAAFALVYFWQAWSRTGRGGRSFGWAWIVVVLSLLVPLPWYIRSYLATGDPWFPFLSNLVQMAGATEGSFSLKSFSQSVYPRTLAGFLGYLPYLTFVYTDLRPWFWAISPAFLAFLPPAIVWAFVPQKDKSRSYSFSVLRMLVVLALATLIINFITAPSYPRYLFPTWICLSLISAWVLNEILLRWPYPGRIIVPVAIILPFLIVFSMGAKRAVEVLPQYFSEDARIAAVQAGFPGYGTFIHANENIDPESSLIISTDPKIYYLDSNAIIATPGIESHILTPWDSPPEEIISNWRELGATHLILDTTLLSVKHGFGIALFTNILGDRDTVWFDIVTTRGAAEEFGIGDILTDDEFLHMSAIGELPINFDGEIDRHLFTREKMELFQSWGRDWMMAETLLKFIDAGILVEDFRSGPGGGLRIYTINLPPADDADLPDLPDVTEWCLEYEDGPFEDL